MLIFPVRAASNQRSNRLTTSSAPSTGAPLIVKDDSCHRMIARPAARPTGTSANDQIGIRYRISPVSIAMKSSFTRLGDGTQSACSTDRTTVTRLRTRRRAAIQPSLGRIVRSNQAMLSPIKSVPQPCWLGLLGFRVSEVIQRLQPRRRSNSLVSRGPAPEGLRSGCRLGAPCKPGSDWR